MPPRITYVEYHALAELRHRIRRCLQEGNEPVRRAGLEPQQYLLLAMRGLPDGKKPPFALLLSG
jgi:hypothetical protein